MEEPMNTIFFLTLALLIISGLPIYVVLGLTSMIMLAIFSNVPAIMVAEVLYNSMSNFTLVAIPLFAITAQFMLKGGIAEQMLNVANALVGHLAGGLALVVVFACMLIAAMSGSSVATAMAVGIIIIPAMRDRGYSNSFSAGVVAASGTMGIMIPPSISFILYGVLTEESIPRLFLAGIIPGLMEATLYAAWIIYFSKRKRYRRKQRATNKEIIRAMYHLNKQG
jgi:C4-dicarboxylate transporter DctM subunit